MKVKSTIFCIFTWVFACVCASPAFGQPPSDSASRNHTASSISATSAPPSVSAETQVAPKVFPVTLNGQTLFAVQERVFSYSPEERAKSISERIERLYKNPNVDIDSIRLDDSEASTDIVTGDVVIMSVTTKDAKAAGKLRQELAKEYADIIRNVANQLKRDYSFKSLALGVTWASLSTLMLFLVFVFVNHIFNKVFKKLDKGDGLNIRPIHIQEVTLLSSARILDLLASVTKTVRFGVWLLLFYIYLPLVFSFFPWTHGWAPILVEFIMQPIRAIFHGITSFLPNVFFICTITLVSVYTIKILRFIFNEIRKGTIRPTGFHLDWLDTTFKIFKFLIIAFTLVVMFPYLPGSSSPAFQGISVFLGLLFSFGSTSAVSNIVAGIVLTYTRAFQVGDRVKIGDTVGDVMEKSLLITRVRTIKNVETSIPNSMVLSSHIINFSYSAKKHGLILNTCVTIGYDVPWRQVHELLISAAQASANVLKDPKPFILQTSLDDFYVSYELNAYTDQPMLMARIYSDLHQNIQDQFNQAGVEIMSPHYGALRDGNTSTIPADHLPKDYVAPGFRLRSEPKTTP